MLRPIAESRRQANAIKRAEPITVVIGNPPYKEKAKGRGGWIEAGSAKPTSRRRCNAWMPPAEWGVGAHAKHLRNLYVYFWRWATWKVFDHDPTAQRRGHRLLHHRRGFLNGPGFQKMRDYLRRDGRRDLGDRLLARRPPARGDDAHFPGRAAAGLHRAGARAVRAGTAGRPRTVRFRSLPAGHARGQVRGAGRTALDGSGWADCPRRDGALRSCRPPTGAWATFPALETCSSTTAPASCPDGPGSSRPIADSLKRRWQKLQAKKTRTSKETLFHPHLVGRQARRQAHARELSRRVCPATNHARWLSRRTRATLSAPVRYGFRSFDRQWIIPDNRVINRPNPTLWAIYSRCQIFLTALDATFSYVRTGYHLHGSYSGS